MHVTHVDAPVALYLPAPHATHDVAEVAPGAPLAVPAVHGMHALAPDAEKVPATHTTQLDAALMGVMPLYFPAAHAWHEVDAGEFQYPAPQQMPQPARLAVRGGHTVHAAEDAPDALYVFAAQRPVTP